MLMKFDFKASQNYQKQYTGLSAGVRQPEALCRSVGDF